MGTKFFFLTTLLIFCLISSTTADTYKSGPHSFVGDKGKIDTGFRSYVLTNATELEYKIVYIEIENVTSENVIIPQDRYNITWEYFQTNIFQNESSKSNARGIAIKVNNEGYKSNLTSIVWRLQIISNITESIEVNLISTYTIQFSVAIGSTFTVTEENPIPIEDLMFLVAVIVTLLVIYLMIYNFWRRLNDSE